VRERCRSRKQISCPSAQIGPIDLSTYLSTYLPTFRKIRKIRKIPAFADAKPRVLAVYLYLLSFPSRESRELCEYLSSLVCLEMRVEFGLGFGPFLPFSSDRLRDSL